jgi:hypothetical protein
MRQTSVSNLVLFRSPILALIFLFANAGIWPTDTPAQVFDDTLVGGGDGAGAPRASGPWPLAMSTWTPIWISHVWTILRHGSVAWFSVYLNELDEDPATIYPSQLDSLPGLNGMLALGDVDGDGGTDDRGASGVYVNRIRTDWGFAKTRKLTLLK